MLIYVLCLKLKFYERALASFFGSFSYWDKLIMRCLILSVNELCVLKIQLNMQRDTQTRNIIQSLLQT